MRLLRALAVLASTAAVVAGTADGHSNIPVAWWLGNKTAAAQLLEAVKPRYQMSNVRSFTARCSGLAPSVRRGGQTVYKHFVCSSRATLKTGVSFSFGYRVHVVGPNGKVKVGG